MSTDPDAIQAVERTALRLLADREHGAAELRRKLLARGHAEERVASVLATLAERRLQSDERFAEAYVEQRAAKGYGPLRIRAELRERGVEEALIDRSLDLDPDAWMDHLRAAHRKKYGETRPQGRAELARRARFLEYRGYPTAQVRRLLDFDD